MFQRNRLVLPVHQPVAGQRRAVKPPPGVKPPVLPDANPRVVPPLHRQIPPPGGLRRNLQRKIRRLARHPNHIPVARLNRRHIHPESHIAIGFVAPVQVVAVVVEKAFPGRQRIGAIPQMMPQRNHNVGEIRFLVHRISQREWGRRNESIRVHARRDRRPPFQFRRTPFQLRGRRHLGERFGSRRHRIPQLARRKDSGLLRHSE